MSARLVAGMLVRPYGAELRARVLDAVARAGWQLEPLGVIPPRTGDSDAIATIRSASARVLVVPFHAHRDERGADIDGLTLLHRLASTSSVFPWRVLMPVSHTGAAALGLRLARAPEVGRLQRLLDERTLVLEEETLRARDVALRIDEHLRGRGA